MVYEWKEGTRIGADAQKVGEELELIEHRDAKAVVEFAKKRKSSELHKCFEWNDSKAADEYRLEQARHLMRLIFTEAECQIKGRQEVVKYRAFESVRIDDDEDDRSMMVYLPTVEALSEEEYRSQIIGGLEETIEQAERTAEKYEHIVPQLKRVRVKLESARQTLRA